MDETALLQQAQAAARQGSEHTYTNPVVGAVIVRDGQVLATGYHQHFGGPHAEINALRQLADPQLAEGATMVVTLEPCSHYGKTPPCAAKLIEVGIKRVIIGQLDPNPVVAGRGKRMLEAACIDVTVVNDPGDLNQAYNFFYQHQRPLVTLKMALTLDGKMNQMAQQRTIITGKIAYQDSQRLRLEQQAILVGEHTLLVDDPQLTVRNQSLDYPPVRVAVVNDADQLPTQLHLWDDQAPTWILSRQPSQREWPANVRVITDPEWQPVTIVNFMAQQGVQSLLVEGGSTVQSRFLTAALVDRLVVYRAPIVLGNGLAAFNEYQENPVAFELVQERQLGQDWRVDLRRK
ncbi:bifunctional diaminohydroxyphosphoribosylaminopyrimidine deaminase/5-amino-6-(5-phosphoribosylamino)uracil reductase RibD [Fructilactobacillus cliffordii]|uniref:bifunctional diaminohydroxyphosphoribosylaminopyrimidine deaminase/5-amino-6-(5-phosphoribosylamino)uracil reductase RibD n=1 Tax=Fructilactobacillus cliffordii TaxID=2940299 RepID=UPI002093E1A2|nr:bifunctional diaminohydroxyphosphoribosylaminopyrimidine deaminase/5-amino-6-(5-phosphoribosylamino)uracil reductase RibD [Fructilactobacillus cliffordii]USS86872.1 bifunctional diaminohydroxyphosphoribosylaminopyrimidine deaminase/5-amino-6-(5-phosphoribosylamino)uracil reductase RibD [Fructilactobacillus cliffordii]